MADTETKAKAGKSEKSEKAPRPEKGDKGQQAPKAAKAEKGDKAAKGEAAEKAPKARKPEERVTPRLKTYFRGVRLQEQPAGAGDRKGRAQYGHRRRRQ